MAGFLLAGELDKAKVEPLFAALNNTTEGSKHLNEIDFLQRGVQIAHEQSVVQIASAGLLLHGLIDVCHLSSETIGRVEHRRSGQKRGCAHGSCSSHGGLLLLFGKVQLILQIDRIVVQIVQRRGHVASEAVQIVAIQADSVQIETRSSVVRRRGCRRRRRGSAGRRCC